MELVFRNLSTRALRCGGQGALRRLAHEHAPPPKVSVASKLNLSPGEIQQFAKRLGQFTKTAEPLLRGEASQSESALQCLETLRGLGFTSSEQRRVVFKNTPILLQKKERIEVGWKVLKTELDLSSEKLKAFFMRDSWGLIRLNQASFQARLDYFVGLGFKRKQFISMVVRHPHLLGYNLGKMVGARFNRYLEEGMSRDEVVEMFDKDPSLFGKSYANSVLPKINWLVREVGVDKHTILHDWLVNYPGCLRNSLAVCQSKYTRLMQKGFSGLEFLAMLKDGGRLLNRDINQIVARIDFIRDVLKKTNKDIAEYPDCLAVSFEHKMTKRVAYLDCKGKDYQTLSLLNLLGPPDDVFAREEADGSKADLKNFGLWWDGLSKEEQLDKIRQNSYPIEFCRSSVGIDC